MKRRADKGFTLVELLVVVAIIAILASLVAPALIKAIGGTDLTNCVAQLRQLGQAHVSYMKDFDFWMVSCGARPGVGITRFIEPPMDYKLAQGLSESTPYWYEALAPYINAAATRENAIYRYCQRTGTDPKVFQFPWMASLYKREIAEMCMLYRCPAKKQSPIGYGYNYAAPFGESIIYPVPREYRHDYPVEEFSWVAGNARTYPFPIFADGPNQPAPIPILWYAQSVRFGVISDPAGQIAVCDTGLIINDDQASGYHPASEWIEATEGHAAINDDGYTRFPLNEMYTKGVGSFMGYKQRYEGHNPDPSQGDPLFNLSWRPAPRHNGRTACLFFDGSVRAVDIMEIVSYDWGHRSCLFDNRPPRRPPCPKLFFSSYGAPTNPLPKRNADGSFK